MIDGFWKDWFSSGSMDSTKPSSLQFPTTLTFTSFAYPATMNTFSHDHSILSITSSSGITSGSCFTFGSGIASDYCITVCPRFLVFTSVFAITSVVVISILSLTLLDCGILIPFCKQSQK